MKSSILKLLNKRIIDYEAFVSQIKQFKRKKLIDDIKEFQYKILATAAPFNYANIIAKNENFNSCLASFYDKEKSIEQIENSGEAKKLKVLAYLESKKIPEIDLFVTDHSDDLPLIKVSKNNWVINPEESFKASIEKMPNTKIIYF